MPSHAADTAAHAGSGDNHRPALTLVTPDTPGTARAPSPEFLRAIPHEFARRHLVLSAGRDDGIEVLRLAASAPPWIPGNIAVELGVPVKTILDDAEHIARDVDIAYAGLGAAPSGSDPESSLDAQLGGAEIEAARLIKESDHDLLNLDGKGPVVRLVDLILFEALTRSASDVHVQPLSDRTLVRYRLDGVLHTARELPAALALAVVTRLKVMAMLDVAERGAPQDGRATVTIGADEQARTVDLRVGTLPTSYGERAVIRLLDNSRGSQLLDLAALGMPARIQSAFLERSRRAHGIVLVTGPTGSGKTTTLYATIRVIAGGNKEVCGARGGRKAGELNIMTIEDPIEYELSTIGLAVSQTQVHPRKGVTFAAGLRHILRQDPDVILVGEIRDAETARTAIQASLTGHLVFSTLHTNDASGAPTRLADLGVEPYLLGASLSAILAQRLVRRTHRTCNGEGCGACLESGYKGRVGVYELLPITDKCRQLIVTGAPASVLRDIARTEGMATLLDEGHRLVAQGITADLELERVLSGVEEITA